MSDIQKITIQVQRPRGSFPGRVEVGYYTVSDGTVTLVEENGVPVDKYKLSRKIPQGGDARAVAVGLVRQRYLPSANGFNGPLQYPRMKF